MMKHDHEESSSIKCRVWVPSMQCGDAPLHISCFIAARPDPAPRKLPGKCHSEHFAHVWRPLESQQKYGVCSRMKQVARVLQEAALVLGYATLHTCVHSHHLSFNQGKVVICNVHTQTYMAHTYMDVNIHRSGYYYWWIDAQCFCRLIEAATFVAFLDWFEIDVS